MKFSMVVLASLMVCAGSAVSWAARMPIEPRNYNNAWQKYKDQDALKTPDRQFPFQDCFEKAAREYSLPVTLLLAVARGESDFNPKAASKASCYGVMQIQWPGTARDMDVNRLADLYDPCINIRAGARYLRFLLDRYQGNMHVALAAYNYGPGRIGDSPRPNAIPRGANWYSGYIYHHLQQVLADSSVPVAGQEKAPLRAAYTPAGKLPLIIFHDPTKARSFMEHLSSQDPSLRLDWFRNTLGESFVVLLFADGAERDRGIQRLRKIGFHVDPRVTF